MKDVRNSAEINECKNRLRNIYLASQLYSTDNNAYIMSTTGENSWNKKLVDSSYLGNITNKDITRPLKCPNGISLDYNYDSNYSLNFKLTVKNKKNTPNPITNSNAKQTHIFMDAHVKESVLWPESIKGKTGHEKIIGNEKRQRIARHNLQANITYLDGQVKSINSSKLLRIGNNYKQNAQFWAP